MVTEINNFGDARRFLIEVMIAIRDDKIPVEKAMAIASTMKVINDNIYAEIKATKMAIEAKDKAHEFGRVVHMGKLLIGDTIK